MTKTDLTYIVQKMKDAPQGWYIGAACFYCKQNSNVFIVPGTESWRCEGCGADTRITSLGSQGAVLSHPAYGPLGSTIALAKERVVEQR